MAESQVTVYGAYWCPDCRRAFADKITMLVRGDRLDASRIAMDMVSC